MSDVNTSNGLELAASVSNRMSVWQRLQVALSPQRFNRFTQGIIARYEAGQQYSTRRSWLPGWVRDARFDADAATRIEILRKARYFERNNGLVNRLADLFEEYTVGPGGLRFVPTSSDEEWNKRAKEWWDQWCQYCDLTSRQTFGTVNSLVARSWMIDGEIFILKTRGKVRDRGQSFPRIQLIESHRVASPQDHFNDSKLVDGVQLDLRGRPERYWVLNDVEKYEPYDASEVVHVFEPSRVGMPRGLSMLYPVVNDIHDLDDLQLLEMDAAKDHAKITNIIKTRKGELSADELRRERWSVSGTKGTSGGSSQKRTQYYDETFKGRAIVLQPDDEFTQFASTRPSVAAREYWDYLTSKICAGVGISKLLVFPYTMQGTVVRADLDVSAAFFRSRSAVLASKFLDVYFYAMDWATRNVLELSDPPADWKNVSVRPPRSVNVDVGRNSSALIEEYKAGWRSLESICGELGEDWRDVLKQRAVERKVARELEKQYGLAEGELISAALEAVKQSSAARSNPQLQEAA